MIEVSHLTKQYGNHLAVDDVSFTVADGQICGLLGPNGAGKTTTISLLSTLLLPTEGEILIDGQNVPDMNKQQLRQMRRKVSMIFQQFNLLMQQTVAKNIAYPMECIGVPRAKINARVKELLEVVGLESKAKAYPAQLSGGQRQRVAIARAMSLNPSAIIADEPTSALDVSVRAQILNLLTDLKKDLGLSMMFISHDIQTVRYISDKIIVMNHGQIMEQGPAKQVFENPQDPYTKLLLGAAPSLLHPKLGE